MGLRISTNVPAINAQRNLGMSQKLMQKSTAQLSSGNRINQSADDAAGLAISENLKAQIRSAAQARRNANDGISLVQTAEGGLGEISNIMSRIRELAVQAASDTVGDNERGLINIEVQQLKNEIERTAQSTAWNSTKLLNGSTPTFDFQIGLYNGESDSISFAAGENVATIDALEISDFDYTTKDGARSSLTSLDLAQTKVNNIRASIGALQNRLSSTADTLAVTEENFAAANSRIRDTDLAATSAELARNQVLLQAGTAALTQANQNNQLALKLLS
jgi:flagellin